MGDGISFHRRRPVEATVVGQWVGVDPSALGHAVTSSDQQPEADTPSTVEGIALKASEIAAHRVNEASQSVVPVQGDRKSVV